MRYEARIAWRYLYGGKRERRSLSLAGCALLISIGGLVQLLTSPGSGSYGGAVLVIGLIAAAVFGLLSIFTVFTSVSVLGVALGVAALTIVLAVTTGFQRQFRDKILGVKAHVIVTATQPTFAEYRDVVRTATQIDPDVVAAQPFILTELLVTRGKGELSGVAIKGVDPKLVRGVLELARSMIEGSVDSLANDHSDVPPIILGNELAHKLKAKLGDDVTVVVPLSNIDFETWSPKPNAPHTRTFRITGIFYSGFDDYDRRLAYMSLRDTQDLLGIGDEVGGVEIKIKDLDRAEAIAAHLETVLGPPYQAQDWYTLNRGMFSALRLQKLALVIILTLIILVAAINMISAVTMMVTDKTREIAILKSMGATSSSIAQIFQFLGVAIGGVGTLLGVAIGLITCTVVSAYGYHLDPKVYLIDRLPIEVRPLEVLLVAGITMVISLFATWAPARSAAALTPIEGLRYD